MRPGIAISLNSSDHSRLVEIAADRNSAQKHVWRAQIVLLSAEGVGTHEIMRATGKTKTGVSKIWGNLLALGGLIGVADA